jgi:hypothetical protein
MKHKLPPAPFVRMEQKIITSRHASDLNKKIEEMIKEGWEPVGGHTVLTTLEQKQFAGNEHKRTIFEYEYAQSMRKNAN